MPTANANSDLRIIEGLKRRDPAALAALYDRYGRIAYSAVFRIVGDSGEAEGVVQEIFLRAWTRAHGITGTLAPWLLTLACSLAIEHLRAVGGREPRYERTAYEFVPASVGFEFSHYADSLEAAFRDLPDEQRTVVKLAYFEGLLQSEIPERRRKPSQTVTTWARTHSGILRNLVTAQTSHWSGKFSRVALAASLIAIVSTAGLLLCELHRVMPQIKASSRSSALGLNASFQPNGALHLSWLPNSSGPRGQVRALLQISDGSKRTPVTLDAAAWRNGSFEYQGQTNDIDVRLTVYAGDQSVSAESVRVMSAFPPSAALLLSTGSPDPAPMPKFVLAAKPVRQLVPPPVVAAWYPPPVEKLSTPLRVDSNLHLASTGARLAIPTFPNDGL